MLVKKSAIIITSVLIAIDSLLVLLYLRVGGEQFDLDWEKNIPTLYQSLKLALGAGLGVALTIYAVNRKHKLAWGFLALMLGYLSLDEWFQIHEQVSHLTDQFLLSTTGRVSFSAWIIAFIPVFIMALVGFYLTYKYVLLQPSFRSQGIHLWFLFGVGLLTLVPVVEIISSSIWDFNGPGNKWWISLEEGLEMIGISILVGMLLAIWKIYMSQSKQNPE